MITDLQIKAVVQCVEHFMRDHSVTSFGLSRNKKIAINGQKHADTDLKNILFQFADTYGYTDHNYIGFSRDLLKQLKSVT
ncbi:hypothetical protein DYU11_11605 [Fibrisoma montanum]|uniref:Uncharacterized protein n=1 Tax=Fibrisoma montanum TaxID=2305895 RepID=A0A418MBA0_9BACT|nr:hypothetical protein DYU11_11605 [Fibrisoma montanum]